jgi:cytochrome d ubiquinol oxidase subunit I
METVGNIAGPLLAYEVLTAFFLEATMLAIMLYGRKRVGETIHTIATLLVALGTTASAFWILVLNSWMHTPAGFEMVNGQAQIVDWLEIIFNPSFPYRLTHMLLASGLTTAFLIAGVSAYRWLRKDHGMDVKAGLRTGIWIAACIIPLQILAGDSHGLNTLQYQPAKIAAMEGIWETQKGAPMVLFALPDEETQTNKYELSIPKLASLYLTHDLNGEIQGLKSFAGEHPSVAPVFWAFRVMVGIGILMLIVSWTAVWQSYKSADKVPKNWLLKGLVLMSFSGWIAVVAGWYVTEIGRQPWLVQGVLRTADAISPILPTSNVVLSLSLYLVLYTTLLISYISVVFYLARKSNVAQDKAITPNMAYV